MTATKHQCKFEVCRLRPWFNGFADAQDLARHRQFHRCLWLIIDKGTSRTTHCTYVPQDEEDLRAHLKTHLDSDALPRTEARGVTTWFCPWQTCKSCAFVVKGTPTKSHLTEHIMGHASLLKSVMKRAIQKTATAPPVAIPVSPVMKSVGVSVEANDRDLSTSLPFNLGSDFNGVMGFELDPESLDLANKLQEEFLQQFET